MELLIEIAASGMWPDAKEQDFTKLVENYIPELEVLIPYQWNLVRYHPPKACESLRQMAVELRQGCESLLALLDLLDQAEEEAQAAGHPDWARFIALLKAPFPITKPDTSDLGDPDAVRLAMRDIQCDGSWDKNLARLEQKGMGKEGRKELQQARSYKEFEETYGVNMSDLLFTDEDRLMNEELRRALAGKSIEELAEMIEEKLARPAPSETKKRRRPRKKRKR